MQQLSKRWMVRLAQGIRLQAAVQYSVVNTETVASTKYAWEK
jgi:hypothetical protein